MIYPKVSIIILNWNGLKDTIECLESLKKITYPNYEVIVVDNGSKGNDADILEEKYGDYIKIIRNKENLGFTGGNNVAIHYALHRKHSPDYVFLLNNDAIPEPNCLTVCVQVAQFSDSAVVGAIIKSTHGGEVFIGTPCSLLSEFFPLCHFISYRPPSPLPRFWEVGRVNGSAMLISRELLERAERERGYYLRPDFFLYLDEPEFCHYTRKSGYKVVMARDAVVYHHYGKSIGLSSPLALYYFTRNKILLANQVLPWHLKVLFHLWYIPARLIQAFLKKVERQPQASAAILQGLSDGYRGVTGKWKYQRD
jgi:hypothetical protein